MIKSYRGAKLLPCPFCGSDDHLNVGRHMDPHVVCNGYACYTLHNANTMAEAVRQWNTRGRKDGGRER